VPNVCKITLYSNGFFVGDEEDGKFRDNSDPKNKAFIAQLKKGEVPDELEADIRSSLPPNTREVGVGLVDKTSESYTAPPEKFSFAKSTGNSLGSGNASESLVSAVAAGFAQAVPVEYVAHEGQESTTLQIVTHDRKKHRLKMNVSATVLQLYQHVMHLSGQAEPTFSLSHCFPPQPITKSDASIHEAGLMNASVTQKL
jgi:hypothetical protein